MKLADLNPELRGALPGPATLWLDCPSCTGENAHRIAVPVTPTQTNAPSWGASGAFPDSFTIVPSVRVEGGRGVCTHFTITAGVVTLHP